jgi:hypothetical protein
LRVIDTFLFSEPYEKDVLFLKIMLGSGLIDEWILIENSYTFQGKYKGHFAQELIDQDKRFDPYRHRITIISENYNPNREASSDSEAFNVEFWQRDLATSYINDLSDDDYFFITDADECVDSSDEQRKMELLNTINRQPYSLYHVSCQRYWYDFDNQYEILYGIPFISVRYFKNSGKSISQLRRENIGPCKQKWKNIICFEYSHCFTLEDIEKKYSSFSHVGTNINDIKEGLTNNCRVLSSDRKHLLTYGPKFFFKTVSLNPQNSPSYVRSNLAILKLGTVDQNYEKNRRHNFPKIFSLKSIIKYHLQDVIGHVMNFLRRRLKRLQK